MPEVQHRGRVEVSPKAIASIVNEAVLTSYGVVGMAAKDLASGIANVLSPDSKRGIDVRIEEGQVIIDVYVIIEYGTRIAAKLAEGGIKLDIGNTEYDEPWVD